jgi:hypothetical protein
VSRFAKDTYPYDAAMDRGSDVIATACADAAS